MGFRDAFQYRRHADIDKGYPDLLGSSKWTLKKVQKIKTANLKLIDSINLSSLNLRIDTIWLAQFYFQRYFTQNAFQANTAVVFVAACVHLACKANDTPRQFEAVIKEMYKLRYAREEVELKKINDMMVLVELKEKVLLAERALLYCFAFDFRTGDPYSFALKYNSAYKLMSVLDGEQALSWLNRAGKVTTLCLQYPPSTLAVVALWFAQHLVRGEVPVDDNGLEWWEKLPIEKQDRVPLPPPTAEAIEDIHWQLVVELDEKSLEAALKGDGKLPGSDCSCKACKVHQRKSQDAAAAASNPAGAAATFATPLAVSAAAVDPSNPPQSPTDAFPIGSKAHQGPGLSSSLLEADKDTGASAPRTGTGNGLAIAGAAEPPLAAGTSSGVPALPKAGNASGAPAHVTQPASPYPARVLHGAGDVSDTPRARSASPAVAALAADMGNNRGAHTSASGRANGLNGHAPQARQAQPMPPPSTYNQQPYSMGSLAAVDRRNHYQGSLNQQVNGSLPSSLLGSHHSPAVSQYTSPLQQHSGHEPVHAHQNGYQQTSIGDDAESLEDGEIEDGEVLPDGTVAGASSDVHTSFSPPYIHAHAHADGDPNIGCGANSHAQRADGTHGSDIAGNSASNGQKAMESNCKAYDHAKKRKRSASPQVDVSNSNE